MQEGHERRPPILGVYDGSGHLIIQEGQLITIGSQCDCFLFIILLHCCRFSSLDGLRGLVLAGEKQIVPEGEMDMRGGLDNSYRHLLRLADQFKAIKVCLEKPNPIESMTNRYVVALVFLFPVSIFYVNFFGAPGVWRCFHSRRSNKFEHELWIGEDSILFEAEDYDFTIFSSMTLLSTLLRVYIYRTRSFL